MITALLLSAQVTTSISIPLQPDLRRYDFEGTLERKAMYMPTMVALAETKPGAIKELPSGFGKTHFAQVTVGNGPKSQFWMVLDIESDRLAVDHNHDGVFDRSELAPVKAVEGSNGIKSLSTTIEFKANYQNGQQTWNRPYFLNFYWRSGATSLGCYRATAMLGSMLVNGSRLEVELTESNNQGVFHERFDTSPTPDKLRPMSLVLNGKRVDPRGTFEWNLINYQASISPDGRNIVLTPTPRIVRAPEPKAAQTQPIGLLAPGTAAPDFVVEARSGGTAKLSDFKGKVVILKFWATWCGPCIASMPHFDDLFKQLKDQNVALLAICVADDRKPYTDWMAKNASKFAYPFFFDPAGREGGIHSKLYGVTGIPTVYVIGRDGKVVGNVVGYSDGDRRLEQLLRGTGLTVKD